MRVHTFIGIMLMILAALWVTGCGRAPIVAAPDEELSADQSQSAEVRMLEEETMTPIPGSEATEVTPPPEAEQVIQLR